MTEYVYILQKYAFYDCMIIVMISKKYTNVKKLFDGIKKENGHGYIITKYEYDKVLDLSSSDGEVVDWVEIGYEGVVKKKRDLGSDVE